MTYDPLSPIAANSPKISPTQIQTNFTIYATAIAVNHKAMNSIGQGKHTNVIFKVQTVNPEVTSTYGVIYAKSVTQASGTAINLFFRTISFIPGVANVPQQITFNSIVYSGYNVSPYTNAEQSFAFGGLLTYTGKITIIGGNRTFSIAPGGGIAAPTKIIFFTITLDTIGITPTGQQNAITVAATGPVFTAPITASPGNVYRYFAIGTV